MVNNKVENDEVEIKMDDENGSSLSIRVPSTYKTQSEVLGKKYETSSSEILRLCLYYGLRDDELMKKFIADKKVEIMKKELQDKKSITIQGVTLNFDRVEYKIMEDKNEIELNFFIGETLIAKNLRKIMSFNV